MEVVFLSRASLEVLDFGYVNSDFQIVIDSVIGQKSTFTVNKENINADIGDFLIIKDFKINYIGIIVSIENDDASFNTKVETTDFISILDIDVLLTSYTGNISTYLNNLITSAYITNNDSKQKMSYLSIDKDYVDINGTLTYEEDTLDSISSLINTLNKAYGISVSYSLSYQNGKIKGIVLHIKNSSNGLILKSNLAAISNLVISFDNTQMTNKMLFIPSNENTTYKKEVAYFLLTDGSVTSDASSLLRYSTINMVCKIFKDDEYSTLETTAKTELLSSSLEHSITFDLDFNNETIKPFIDFNVGDFIKFITPNKTYQTLITQISIKNTFSKVSITLGEYRGSLTDKIKLLLKK